MHTRPEIQNPIKKIYMGTDETMSTNMNINLQLLITAILGVTLLSMVYMHYDEELILALITGLVGVLVPIKTTNTNNEITTQEAIRQLQNDPNIQVQTETIEIEDDKQEYS